MIIRKQYKTKTNQRKQLHNSKVISISLAYMVEH